MEDTPAIAAARRFLILVREGFPPSDQPLARSLDELAVAYHEAPEGDPTEDEVEAPEREDYRERYARLGERFPDYGYYSIADWSDALNKECLVADAIDDLADIVGDLTEVVWRFDNIGPDDAHWYFKFLFEAHWGRHLRHLSLYLYGRIGIRD